MAFPSPTLQDVTVNGSANISTAAITGGAIDGTIVGGTTPAAVSATTLAASGTVSGPGFTSLLSPYTLSSDLSSTATGKGAALIGWPSGYGINQPSTGLFFSGNGAAIQRLNDRVFVGAAGVNDGAFPNITQDWLSTFQTSKSVSPAIVSAQFASLTPEFGAGGQAIVGGGQTLYFGAANGAAIGVSGYGLSNNATFVDYAWAFYGEGHRLNTGTGGAWGMELDVTNFGDLTTIDPYGQTAGTTGGQVIGLQLSAGANFSATGQQAPSAALLVGANPVAFDKGIVFQTGSISGSRKEVLSMAQGHTLQWYDGLNTPTASITSTAATLANSTILAFAEGALSVRNASSTTNNFQVYATAGVNWLTVTAGTTGNPPILGAAGTDTDIDVQISPKGAGLVRFGTYTAGALTATGYITIKDQSGTTRRLLVG